MDFWGAIDEFHSPGKHFVKTHFCFQISYTPNLPSHETDLARDFGHWAFGFNLKIVEIFISILSLRWLWGVDLDFHRFSRSGDFLKTSSACRFRLFSTSENFTISPWLRQLSAQNSKDPVNLKFESSDMPLAASEAFYSRIRYVWVLKHASSCQRLIPPSGHVLWRFGLKVVSVKEIS